MRKLLRDGIIYCIVMACFVLIGVCMAYYPQSTKWIVGVIVVIASIGSMFGLAMLSYIIYYNIKEAIRKRKQNKRFAEQNQQR